MTEKLLTGTLSLNTTNQPTCPGLGSPPPSKLNSWPSKRILVPITTILKSRRNGEYEPFHASIPSWNCSTIAIKWMDPTTLSLFPETHYFLVTCFRTSRGQLFWRCSFNWCVVNVYCASVLLESALHSWWTGDLAHFRKCCRPLVLLMPSDSILSPRFYYLTRHWKNKRRLVCLFLL